MATNATPRSRKQAPPPKPAADTTPSSETTAKPELRATGSTENVVPATPPPESKLPKPWPSKRELRVYAFDPSRGRRLGNYMTIRVKFETLEEGLKGGQIHVIDYDAINNTYYQQAELNSVAALVDGGYAPSESDPRFHQQMCYAVAMNTIKVFEDALGRDIRYRFEDPDPNDPDKKSIRTELRIFPHAMFEANAYYAPELGALLFGYFQASEEDAGTNLPGGTIFTCLSHDIVAHETTHSIVDTLRKAFMKPTNKDVLAFHEAFSDIVALFQHFRFEDVVTDTLQRSGGVLHRFELTAKGDVKNGDAAAKPAPFIIGEMPENNPLLDLARQFGESMGTRKALRSALGIPPDAAAEKKLTEVHERGAILVAAVFDAYFSCFMQRCADLVRLGRAVAQGDEIHPDIAARLAKEAAKTAGHFNTMCIRALDYCPPVDISFGDFLRALITADTDLYQSDDHDYREALIQAFRARGIAPKDVKSLAEESLLWNEPDPCVPRCEGLKFNLDQPHADAEDNAKLLDGIIRGNHNPWYFGICDDVTHDTAEQCTCVVTDPERLVQSVNMMVRAGQSRPTVQFVAEIVRTLKETPETPGQEFSGGSTVVFDSTGKAKYIIYKKLNSLDRRLRQNDFNNAALEVTALANYTDITSAPLQLAAIHRGF